MRATDRTAAPSPTTFANCNCSSRRTTKLSDRRDKSMATKNTKSAKQNRPRRFAEARGSAAEELQPLVKELRTLSEGWRNSPGDPHNIANAVMVALLEVSNAIVRAYGEPPND